MRKEFSGRFAAGVVALAGMFLASGPSPAAAAPSHRADGSSREWRGAPSFIAGQTVLSRGELIHTDYLQDDYGPDLNDFPNQTAFARLAVPTDGDHRYPDEERYADNAADLRELRLAIDRGRVHLMVRMQTMVDPTAVLVMFAFDSDGDATTGAGAWPANAGIEATPGADRFLVVSGERGRVFVAGAGEKPHALDVSGLRVTSSARTNTIEVSLPRRALRLRPGARVNAIAGLATPRGEFVEQDGDGTAAFDAAFQGDEEFGGLRGWWSDRKQSRLLAGGDLSELSAPLPIRAMRRGRSRPHPPLEPGYYNAIYRSRIGFGEGVRRRQQSGQPVGGESSFSMVSAPIFRSRHQPYGLYIPQAYRPGRSQMTLVGHSLGWNHNQYGVLTPNLLRQLGDERNSVLVTPSARGTDTAYLEAGFEDAVEALEHAQQQLETDPRRVSLTGYSMGGYMTYRLGLLMPDRFARASVYAGPPAYAVWPAPAEPIAEEPEWIEPGQTNKIVENAVNLPYEIVHGSLDELVPISGVLEQVARFRRLRLEHRFYHHQADDHNTFAVYDEWGRTRDWLGEARIPRCPRYLTYKRYPIMDLPRLGRRFDGAYWLERVVRRGGNSPQDAGPNDFALVEAESRARPGRATAVEEIDEPVSGPTTPGRLSGWRPVREDKLPRRNTLRLRLTDVAGLRIELRCAGIDPERRVRVAAAADGPVRLALAGDWPARVRARLDGRPVDVTRTAPGIVVTAEPAADGSVLVLSPR